MKSTSRLVLGSVAAFVVLAASLLFTFFEFANVAQDQQQQTTMNRVEADQSVSRGILQGPSFGHNIDDTDGDDDSAREARSNKRLLQTRQQQQQQQPQAFDCSHTGARSLTSSGDVAECRPMTFREQPARTATVRVVPSNFSEPSLAANLSTIEFTAANINQLPSPFARCGIVAADLWSAEARKWITTTRAKNKNVTTAHTTKLMIPNQVSVVKFVLEGSNQQVVVTLSWPAEATSNKNHVVLVVDPGSSSTSAMVKAVHLHSVRRDLTDPCGIRLKELARAQQQQQDQAPSLSTTAPWRLFFPPLYPAAAPGARNDILLTYSIELAGVTSLDLFLPQQQDKVKLVPFRCEADPSMGLTNQVETFVLCSRLAAVCGRRVVEFQRSAQFSRLFDVNALRRHMQSPAAGGMQVRFVDTTGNAAGIIVTPYLREQIRSSLRRVAAGISSFVEHCAVRPWARVYAGGTLWSSRWAVAAAKFYISFFVAGALSPSRMVRWYVDAIRNRLEQKQNGRNSNDNAPRWLAVHLRFERDATLLTSGRNNSAVQRAKLLRDTVERHFASSKIRRVYRASGTLSPEVENVFSSRGLTSENNSEKKSTSKLSLFRSLFSGDSRRTMSLNAPWLSKDELLAPHVGPWRDVASAAGNRRSSSPTTHFVTNSTGSAVDLFLLLAAPVAVVADFSSFGEIVAAVRCGLERRNQQQQQLLLLPTFFYDSNCTKLFPVDCSRPILFRRPLNERLRTLDEAEGEKKRGHPQQQQPEPDKQQQDHNDDPVSALMRKQMEEFPSSPSGDAQSDERRLLANEFDDEPVLKTLQEVLERPRSALNIWKLITRKVHRQREKRNW